MASVNENESKQQGKTGAAKRGGGNKDLPEVNENDVLMASTMAAMDWAAKRWRQIGLAALALALAGGAYAGYAYHRADREEKATALATKAALAQQAEVATPQTSPEVLKRINTVPSEEERSKIVLASFSEARTKFGDTGPGMLARLGEAGALLDAKKWDEALAAFEEVRRTALANADANVRLRCIEGIGYAREGKGAVEEARRAYEELANMSEKGAKPLGLYHQARLDLLKGDKPAAILKLKQAHEILGGNGPVVGPPTYLRGQVDRLLGDLDPNAVPKAPRGGPGKGGLTPEMIQRLKAQGVELPEGM